MISVIIPIYNAGAYLERCLESVCGQTFRDLEILLVDDGSTDSSPQICRRYQAADSRVQVIRQENGGLIRARQTGVRAASGDFVGWTDSDDWLEADYFAQLAAAQAASGADFVAANHFHDIGGDSKVVRNHIPPGVYRWRELLPNLLYSGSFFSFGLQPHVYTKLIRRDIITRAELAIDPRIRAGEDAAAIYPSVLEAEQIAVTSICGYHYVQRQGSMVKTENPEELQRFRLLYDHLAGAFAQKGVLEEMLPQLREYEKYFLFSRHMKILDQQILLPYGGIPLHSRVVIYGAGVLGQKMQGYLSEGRRADVVLWIDKNYAAYQKAGLDVRPPEAVRDAKGRYDFVLIAHTEASAAGEMRNRLLDLEVPEEKIRWFSQRFIDR